MTLHRLLLPLVLSVAAFAAFAQPYPSKPVKIVVATGAGTTDDVGARVVADKMSQLLGQQFIVENRPGAGGSIGQTYVMNAAPDGYTLLLAGGSMAGARYANANVAYDLLKDFTPISQLANFAFALVVNPNLPVKNVKEFIALAKAQPGKISYGTIGAGQIPYWGVMLFNGMAGIQALEVPYKATPEVLTDIMAGRVDYYVTGLSSALPIKDKVKILAVTTVTRAEQVPDVPTLAEAALPGYEMPAWHSIVGPAKLPADIVAKLNAAIVTSLNSPDVRERYLKAGLDPAPGSPQDLRRQQEKWIAIFGKIAKDVGLQPK